MAAPITPSKAVHKVPRKAVRRTNLRDDPVAAIYAQMTGTGYRRLGAFQRLLRFSWGRYAIGAVATLLFGFLLGRMHLQALGAPTILWSQMLLYVLVFCSIFFGGGWIMPSIFGTWLRNTARRGYLRDLAIAGVNPADILCAHYIARIRTLQTNVFLLFVYFWGFTLGLDSYAAGSGVVNDYLLLIVFSPLVINSMLLIDCDAYRRALHGGWSSLPRLWHPSFLLFVYVIISIIILFVPSLIISSLHSSLTTRTELIASALLSAYIHRLGVGFGRMHFTHWLPLVAAGWDDIRAQAEERAGMPTS